LHGIAVSLAHPGLRRSFLTASPKDAIETGKVRTTMTDRLVLVPGPDHPITISSTPGRVTATVGGRTIAESAQALTLREQGYAAVQYIRRADVDMSALERTDHGTYCPYKGEAHYFSINADDNTVIDNAVWTYESPYPAVAEIKDHVAFYPDRVSLTQLAGN